MFMLTLYVSNTLSKRSTLVKFQHQRPSIVEVRVTYFIFFAVLAALAALATNQQKKFPGAREYICNDCSKMEYV